MIPAVRQLDLTRSSGSGGVEAIRRAIFSVIVSLVRETRARIVVEGVEREEERTWLFAIHHGPGYLLRRPGPLPSETVAHT